MGFDPIKHTSNLGFDPVRDCPETRLHSRPCGGCRRLDICHRRGQGSFNVVPVRGDRGFDAAANGRHRRLDPAPRCRECRFNPAKRRAEEGFDAIVSNPPYFVDALTCPDQQRTIARHTISLTYEGLMKSAFRLLKPVGMFSLVIPSECRSTLESEACLAGFFLSRVTLIRTTPKKQPKRQLIEFKKHSGIELIIEDGIIEKSPNVRSEWYQQLTKDFYIR